MNYEVPRREVIERRLSLYQHALSIRLYIIHPVPLRRSREKANAGKMSRATFELEYNLKLPHTPACLPACLFCRRVTT